MRWLPLLRREVQEDRLRWIREEQPLRVSNDGAVHRVQSYVGTSDMDEVLIGWKMVRGLRKTAPSRLEWLREVVEAIGGPAVVAQVGGFACVSSALLCVIARSKTAFSFLDFETFLKCPRSHWTMKKRTEQPPPIKAKSGIA